MCTKPITFKLAQQQMDTWNKFWLTMVIIGLLCQSAISVGGICAQIVHGNFYELSALSSEDDYVLDVSNMNGKIYFNLCSYARTKCAGMSNSFAVFKNDDLCIPLTTSSLTSSYNSSLIKYTDGTSGLNISFEGIVNQDEEAISSNATKYKVEFDLQCISGQTNYNWNNPSPHFYAENGTFVVRGQGAVNCPKYNGSFIVDFMNKFSFLYAILAILIGSGLSFYGYKLYRPTIFTIGFLFGFIAIGLFLFAVWTSQDSSQYKGWIILILALVAGTGAGLLVITFAWIGLVASGAILGFFIALIAYLLVLYHIVSYPPNLLFYNILLVGMVGGAISGYEFQDIILVLSCGISGAYLVVRGLSVFFGGFPNEFELASKIRTGQDTGIGLAFFFYMILMAGAAAGGIWYQLKLKKEDHDRAEGNDIAEGLAAKELN